ncbi:hypothetical protein CYMTET_16863 [Cymbomonas tetramitiformis]|uniref:Uncharacterized protein n=1 Tax=Cymbomonas tetramitiformis TaxID=36881 RepID=A0AAE0L7Q4_9CHLO|nr:hypothetical protein CYMTET_16863 [Cymbomonas tetramitiformis]
MGASGCAVRRLSARHRQRPMLAPVEVESARPPCRHRGFKPEPVRMEAESLTMGVSSISMQHTYGKAYTAALQRGVSTFGTDVSTFGMASTALSHATPIGGGLDPGEAPLDVSHITLLKTLLAGTQLWEELSMDMKEGRAQWKASRGVCEGLEDVDIEAGLRGGQGTSGARQAQASPGAPSSGAARLGLADQWQALAKPTGAGVCEGREGGEDQRERLGLRGDAGLRDPLLSHAPTESPRPSAEALREGGGRPVGRRFGRSKRENDVYIRLCSLMRECVKAAKKRDLESSQLLCKAVGLDFTKVQQAIPFAELMRRSKIVGSAGPVALDVHRMLGTAMVHAFIAMNSVLHNDQEAIQLEMAAQAEWQGFGRSFVWCRGLFQEMLATLKGAGWLQRSLLYRLVLLQESDGSFAMSQEIVNLLRAGENAESMADTLLVQYDMEAAVGSIPEDLWRLCRGAGAAERLWATLLVRATYLLLPVRWIVNPWAKATMQEDMAEAALAYVRRAADHEPELADILDDLCTRAQDIAARWSDAHVAQIQAIQESTGWLPASMRKKPQHVLWWNSAVGWMRVVASSHPLVAIYMVGPNDPFARHERTLVQFNTFICMFCLCMAFYYSKVATCCTQLQEWVGCPFPASHGECLGSATCGLLNTAKKEGWFPEELAQGDFVCNAFPSATWTGRLYAVLVINAVLIPVNIILVLLFSSSGAGGSAPGHMKPNAAKAASRLMGPAMGPVAANTAIFLYAVFFDIKLLTKSMAMLFMACFMMLFRPVANLKGSFKGIVKAVNNFLTASTRCYDRACYFVWFRLLRMQAEPVYSSIYADPLEKYEVMLVGPMDTTADKLAYIFLALFWAMTVWVMLTYGKLVREMMGSEAEKDLITLWGMTLLTQQLGMKGLQLMAMRTAGKVVLKFFQSLMQSKSALSAYRWYEEYSSEKLVLTYDSSAADGFLAETDITV